MTEPPPFTAATNKIILHMNLHTVQISKRKNIQHGQHATGWLRPTMLNISSFEIHIILEHIGHHVSNRKGDWDGECHRFYHHYYYCTISLPSLLFRLMSLPVTIAIPICWFAWFTIFNFIREHCYICDIWVDVHICPATCHRLSQFLSLSGVWLVSLSLLFNVAVFFLIHYFGTESALMCVERCASRIKWFWVGSITIGIPGVRVQ